MQCENCKNDHEGTYGSGRFCSIKCARGFSTKNKRQEINEKVSKKLDGRKNPQRSQEYWKNHGAKVRQARDLIRNEKIKNLSWDQYSDGLKRHVLMLEHDNKCRRCHLDTWQGEKLILELEHIDGNHFNNAKNNLEFLCPNCHSLTKTWRGRMKNSNAYQRTVSNKEFINALRSTTNVRQALIKLGLSPRGGNYKRAHELLNQTER